MPDSAIKNILTIDVEEWYQTYFYRDKIDKKEWHRMEGGIPETIPALMDLLDRHKAKATFFVVAYNAQRYPELIRQIAARGHGIAAHSFYHTPVSFQTPGAFKNETELAKKTLEDIAQKKVIGFRAPNWSVNDQCPWALEILHRLGFLYDSSLTVPVFRRLSGVMPPGLKEIPRSSLRMINFELPFGGGFYLRAYPYAVTKKCIMQGNLKKERALVYVHPWELEQGRPLPGLNMYERLVTGYRRNTARQKLAALLGDFAFGSIEDIYFGAGT
jgi:polysaccharide deacetylase family protein (PEP-CTERM system associated)